MSPTSAPFVCMKANTKGGVIPRIFYCVLEVDTAGREYSSTTEKIIQKTTINLVF